MFRILKSHLPTSEDAGKIEIWVINVLRLRGKYKKFPLCVVKPLSSSLPRGKSHLQLLFNKFSRPLCDVEEKETTRRSFYI